MSSKPRPRYRVSDLGFSFAVHDTLAPESYEHPAGREKDHPSTNLLNSQRLEVFPNRAMAQAYADELNARWSAESRRAG